MALFEVNIRNKVVKNKIRYLSLDPADFHSFRPDIGDIQIDNDQVDIQGANETVTASVQLPHGATILSAVVYGTGTEETWQLIRNYVDSVTSDTVIDSTALSTSKMATGAAALVDNTKYSYHIRTSDLDASDAIYGAVITYSVPFDFEEERLDF